MEKPSSSPVSGAPDFADDAIGPTSPLALSAEEATIPFEALEFGETVGSGAFGQVFRGKYRGVDVAIKALAVRALQSDNMIKYLHTEVAALRCVTRAADLGDDFIYIRGALSGQRWA